MPWSVKKSHAVNFFQSPPVWYFLCWQGGMETQFYIVYNMRDADGWVSFGKFFIGNNRKAAQRIFKLLQGTADVQIEYPLTIEFMETVNGLPVNLNMINCTLDQLTENTRVITKELFRLRLGI